MVVWIMPKRWTVQWTASSWASSLSVANPRATSSTEAPFQHHMMNDVGKVTPEAHLTMLKGVIHFVFAG